MTSDRRENLDRLFTEVLAELRRIARRHLRNGIHGFEQTLGTTDLVNEAYVKLVERWPVHWRDRSHFLALAARTMRNLLIDRARARRAEKRGGGRAAVTLEDDADANDRSLTTLFDVDQAMVALEAMDSRIASVVEMRFFGGYSEQETADALGVTTRTVQRDWLKAKVFLLSALSP